MNDISAVETLREIRANFAALQAELDAARARIAELESALKNLALAAANDMRHTGDDSNTGWLALQELSAALSEANRLTQLLSTAPKETQ